MDVDTISPGESRYDEPEGGYLRTPPAIGKGQRIYAGSLYAFFAIGP
jgi:hypothetical protein